jgi:hypothetical protein
LAGALATDFLGLQAQGAIEQPPFESAAPMANPAGPPKWSCTSRVEQGSGTLLSTDAAPPWLLPETRHCFHARGKMAVKRTLTIPSISTLYFLRNIVSRRQASLRINCPTADHYCAAYALFAALLAVFKWRNARFFMSLTG